MTSAFVSPSSQLTPQTDIIEDVLMEDIGLYPSDQCLGYQGVYAKSWIGYVSN